MMLRAYARLDDRVDGRNTRRSLFKLLDQATKHDTEVGVKHETRLMRQRMCHDRETKRDLAVAAGLPEMPPR